MIPSRPLTLVEIIGQTFSITRAIFLRHVVLWLVLVLLPATIATLGYIQSSTNAISQIQHGLEMSDTDLTVLRNESLPWIGERYPLYLLGVPDSLTESNGRHTYFHLEQVEQFVSDHGARFTNGLAMTITGFVLLVIGAIALVAITIDLAAQRFEERSEAFLTTLRDTFRRHFWRVLLLYLLYIATSLLIDFILGNYEYAKNPLLRFLAGFISLAELFVLLRMTVVLPALVSEELNPFRAIRRSWKLVGVRMLRVFGISFAFLLILLVIALGFSVPLGLLFSSAAAWVQDVLTRNPLTFAWLRETYPGFVWGIAGEFLFFWLMLGALFPVFLTVLYYDLRTRLDGPLNYLEE